MNEEELARYMERKREEYSSPEVMNNLKQMVSYMLNIEVYGFAEKVLAGWTLEILCFTIHTTEGRGMYLALLEHLGKHHSQMAKKYWEIYDNQENIIERYRR